MGDELSKKLSEAPEEYCKQFIAVSLFSFNCCHGKSCKLFLSSLLLPANSLLLTPEAYPAEEFLGVATVASLEILHPSELVQCEGDSLIYPARWLEVQ